MASTNPARGMRDFLPADVRKREYVIGIIKNVYESYGFEPLETPAVENLETLTGKYGEEGNQLIFKILKRGEKLDESLDAGNGRRELADLALRYDLTVPLARVVANRKNDIPKFFKRYQIQPVWRADRPARGRFREFWQCDVDVIGSGSMVVEAELMSAVTEILLTPRQAGPQANFDDFVILVNHREILFGLLEAFDVPETAQSEVLVVIDKADKIGLDVVLKELIGKGTLPEKHAEKLVMEMFSSVGEPRDTPDTRSPQRIREDENEEELQRMDNLIGQTKSGKIGLAAVREFLKLSNALPSRGHIRFQSSLARGLSYYTGAIFEVGLDEGDFRGSLGGGGRYDGLIGMFGKEQIPACGFSLGLERILVVMDERNMFPPAIAESTPADVMVTIWSEETIGESLKLAHELRSQNLRVTLYPEPDKIGKQIKYADSIKVPFVCVLGENEIAEGKVTLKNMRTGEQQTLSKEKVASKLTV